MLVRKKLQKNTIKTKLFLLSLIILPLINYAIFFVYQNVSSLLMAFQEYSYETGQYKFIGFDNILYWFSMFTNPSTKDAQWTSFFNMFRAVPINIVLCPIIFIVSYSFYKNIRCEKMFRVIIMLPSIISFVVTSILWRQMFSYDFGVITKIIEKFTGERYNLLDPNKDYMWPIIYAFCFWQGLGGNVITIAAAMQRIPDDLHEAGMIDGVGFWTEAFYIVLPLTMTHFSLYLIAIISSPLGFGVNYMFLVRDPGYNSNYYAYSWMVYDQTLLGTPDALISVATIGFVYTIVWTPLLLGARKFFEKITPDVDF